MLTKSAIKHQKNVWNLFKVNNKDTRMATVACKVNNKNTRKMCEICSKLTIKTLEPRHWDQISHIFSGILIVDFELVNTGWGGNTSDFKVWKIIFFSIECSSIGPGVGKAGSDKVIQPFPFSVKESILPNLFQTSSSEKIHYFKLPSEGWVFVYELSGCGFESRCSHLNFRFRACSEQGVPWHSGNYRVWIRSETRTWHDNNIQSFSVKLQIFYLCFN